MAYNKINHVDRWQESRARGTYVWVEWQGATWSVYGLHRPVQAQSNTSADGVWCYVIHTTHNAAAPRALRMWYDNQIDISPRDYLDKVFGVRSGDQEKS